MRPPAYFFTAEGSFDVAALIFGALALLGAYFGGRACCSDSASVCFGAFRTSPAMGFIHYADGTIISKNNLAEKMCAGADNIFFVIREKEKFAAELARLSENSNRRLGEFKAICGQGEIVALVFSSYFRAGRQKHYFTVVNDMTERNEFEKQLHRAARAEAVGTLTSSLGHEFSNILQNINLHTQLILRKTGEDGIKMQAQMLKDSVEKGSAFARSLTSYNKDVRKNYQILSVKNVLDRTVHKLQNILPNWVTLEYQNNAEDLQARIVESRFEQAVIGVCRSALEKTEQESTISISLNYENGQNGASAQLKISVPAPAEEQGLTDIFETIKTSSDVDTGLRFASLKKFVIDIGGFLEITGDENHTEYMITFPAVK